MWMKRNGKPRPQEKKPNKSLGLTLSPDGYRTVESPEELQTLGEELSQAKRIALAIELTTKHVVDAEVIGASFATERGTATYVPVGIAVPLSDLLRTIRGPMENPDIEKIGSETKLWYGLLEQHGIEPRGFQLDTTIASYLLDPDELNHSTDVVSRRFIGHEPVDRAALLTVNRKRRKFSEVPLAEASRSVSERADVVFTAADPLSAALKTAGCGTRFVGCGDAFGPGFGSNGTERNPC